VRKRVVAAETVACWASWVARLSLSKAGEEKRRKERREEEEL
jgi:hypothetical protein